jgi:hypothetical protein
MMGHSLVRSHLLFGYVLTGWLADHAVSKTMPATSGTFPSSRARAGAVPQEMAEASGGRTGKEIDNKGNPLESIRLPDQNLNIRRWLAQF